MAATLMTLIWRELLPTTRCDWLLIVVSTGLLRAKSAVVLLSEWTLLLVLLVQLPLPGVPMLEFVSVLGEYGPLRSTFAWSITGL